MKYWRITASILVIIMAFTLPWWVAFLAAIACVFLFNHFYEIFVVGIILDSLYGAPAARFHSFQFVITVAAFVIFILVALLKQRFVFWKNER